MGKKLFVGSLPYDTTDQQLQEIFSACGRVESAKVIIDRMSGRSKGFGFVEMATDLEAQAAVQKLNGFTVGSRQIVVNEARPMEDRKKPGGGYGGHSGGGGGFGGPRGGGDNFGNRDGGFGGGKRDTGGFSSRGDMGGGGRRRDNRRGGKKHSDEDFGNRW